MTSQKGFTLVEMIVTISIIGILSTLLLVNFRSTSTGDSARRETANVVESDLRRVQSMAIAGSGVNGSPVCGFGAHQIRENAYILFARPLPSSGSCKSDSRERVYLEGDLVIEERVFHNIKMQFLGSTFEDVYFEIPNPTTFLDGSRDPSHAPVGIKIVVQGTTTPATMISVYNSGRIEVSN